MDKLITIMEVFSMAKWNFEKTKIVCLTGVLTALYCVLSAFVKIPIIGHIQLDLGYIVLGFSCAMIGYWSAVVGVVGCVIESVLFTALGFSPSWAVANLIIGLIGGLLIKKFKNVFVRIGVIILINAIAIVLVKSLIECFLYGIPFEVKIVKGMFAGIADSICMIVGLFIAYAVNGVLKTGKPRKN